MWALLEDLLLVQLGLVVGRVALVEVGHRLSRGGASLAYPGVPAGRVSRGTGSAAL